MKIRWSCQPSNIGAFNNAGSLNNYYKNFSWANKLKQLEIKYKVQHRVPNRLWRVCSSSGGTTFPMKLGGRSQQVMEDVMVCSDVTGAQLATMSCSSGRLVFPGVIGGLPMHSIKNMVL